MGALALLSRVPIWGWILVGLLVFGGLQTARLHHAKADLVVARAETATAEAAADKLHMLVATQNLGIAADRAERATAAKALAAALAKAKPVAARHQAKAASLAAYTPKGDDACAQLVDLDQEIAR